MNKSILTMVLELQRRVTALEARPVNVAPQEPVATVAAAPVKRAMCPKCGEKPNYFFHVKTCPGKKNNKNAEAEDPLRRRDPSTT